MEQRNARKLWLIWIVSTVLMSTVLVAGLTIPHAAKYPVLAQVRSIFAPGSMTSGHYQIELACEACHTSPFGGSEVLQKACVGCHGGELAEAEDKHPLSKFTDPRNAELLERLDARECVTCHREHQPQITLAMGVTQPADVCLQCHRDVATERPSHRNMKFDSCTSSGCHNFHDNRALYEDFLTKHAAEPQNKVKARLPNTDFLAVAAALPTYPLKQYPIKALTVTEADAPASQKIKANSKVHDDWLASSHARAGVNCSACHQPSQTLNAVWEEHPTEQVCNACHSLEAASFLSGKHGMRLNQGLTAMTPSQARLRFKREAAHSELTCTSCHGAHRFDRQRAAAEACEQCHNDEHTLAYEQSPHAKLWRQELLQQSPPGSGVSCASCHMPRLTHSYEELDLRQTYVQHNQNDTLRPNEKMIRPVCMNCHGLKFSIDSLADTALVRRNFFGLPATHVKSIDMALERVHQHKEKKPASTATAR